MGFLITLRIAIRALAKNKMRAGLTVLGVVIGIAAVTTMVSIGQSASMLVQSQISNLGSNVIVVLPASRRQRGVRQGQMPSITWGDSEAIGNECPSVAAATPLIGAAGQLVYGNSNWSPREMFGVGRDYLTVRNWELNRGGFFTERDEASAAKVCIIGRTIQEKLFQTSDPLDQTIRIRSIPFRVIGVLQEKGANMFGEDQDNIVLMPHTSVRKRLQGSAFDNVNAIMVSARSADRMQSAQNEIHNPADGTASVGFGRTARL